jgi:hypothetical protein
MAAGPGLGVAAPSVYIINRFMFITISAQDLYRDRRP